MNNQKKRIITVITVGDKNYNPTSEEMQSVVEQFMAARHEPKDAVVAVKFPYAARVLDVTASEYLMASTGWLSDADILACNEAFQKAQYGIPAHTDARDAAGIAAFRVALDKRMKD
jgi:hypothetical protein